MRTEGWRRWLYGTWAVMEVLVFGGLVYGWPSLVILLQQRGVYRDRCSDVSMHASSRHDNRTSRHYSVIDDDAAEKFNSSEFVPQNTTIIHDEFTSTSNFVAKNKTAPMHAKSSDGLSVNRTVGVGYSSTSVLPFENKILQSGSTIETSEFLSNKNAKQEEVEEREEEDDEEKVKELSSTMASMNSFGVSGNVATGNAEQEEEEEEREEDDEEEVKELSSTMASMTSFSVSGNVATGNVTVGTAGDRCPEQGAAFALAYTVVAALQSAGSVCVAQAQRVLGMRATRIGTGLILIAGLLMVAFLTPDNSALLIPGMTCVAVAGLALLVSNIPLAALFPRGHTTFVGLLSGCFDVSAIMQLVIKTIISSGASFRLTYIGFAVLSSLTMVSAALWLPSGPVVPLSVKTDRELDISLEETEPIQPAAAKSTTTNGSSGGDLEPVHESTPAVASSVTSPTLLSCLTSPLFVLHVLWFSLLQLRLFFFVGVLNRWLMQLTRGNEDEVSHFTSVQLYTGMASIVFAVLVGSLYDVLRHRHKDSGGLGGAVVPLLVGSGLCLTLSLLTLVPVTPVLYVTFLLLAAFRSCVYSMAAAFIALAFPAQLFGVLYGCMLIAAGLVGCLQFPLFLWSEQSKHSIVHVNIFLLCTTALTFTHPLYLLWRCRIHQKK